MAAIVENEKALSILNEAIFRDDENLASEVRHGVNLKDDSYIWAFTGRRGSGKTTTMTYYAAKCMFLYNMRVLSNYPIEFVLCREDGSSYVCKSEQLDLYKLLCFDNDYHNCLICIDEAPDIISHMAAATWKNRLLNVFVRQLRKNGNSLFLGAQDFNLIDKGMRWQTDILVECQDAAKKYGNSEITRGSIILLKFLDASGMWTGQTYEEEIQSNSRHGVYDEVGLQGKFYSSVLWGDEGHKPVFDSLYVQDVFESLKRVDMKLGAYKVGSNDEADKYPVSPSVLQSAIATIESVLSESEDKRAMYQKDFYQSLGGLTDADKNNLGKVLSRFGIARGGDHSSRWYDFTTFDINGFRDYVKTKGGIE